MMLMMTMTMVTTSVISMMMVMRDLLPGEAGSKETDDTASKESAT